MEPEDTAHAVDSAMLPSLMNDYRAEKERNINATEEATRSANDCETPRSLSHSQRTGFFTDADAREAGIHDGEQSTGAHDRKFTMNPLITYFHQRRFTMALRNAAPRLSSTRRMRNRLVQKCGLCNISLVNVPKQGEKFVRDIFTTVIEMKWRWCLFIFCSSFSIFWSLFTLIYYTLLLYHGDFENGTVIDDDAYGWQPCIVHGTSLLNIFIFAFTTQSTIGYGYRYPSDECPLVIVTMCVQWMIGLISQTLMAGVIFAKLARPKKRAATILFSKNAVICVRDGKLCLLLRVGDMRKSSLAEAHIRLQMIKKCMTQEGELLPFHQFDMNVGYDSGLDRVFVMWPITICHEIDAASPLYEVSKHNLHTARFEIIAILEGVVESVGSTTQARTSYLPDEILWGKRFEKLVTYQRENGDYRIDFGKFHNVYDVPTPTMSAKEMDKQMHTAATAAAAAANVVNDETDMDSNFWPTCGATKVASTGVKFFSDINHDVLQGPHFYRKFANNASIQPIRNNARPRKISVDSVNEERTRVEGIIIQRNVTGSTLALQLESPDTEQRRKTSYQVRRGPDLF